MYCSNNLPHRNSVFDLFQRISVTRSEWDRETNTPSDKFLPFGKERGITICGGSKCFHGYVPHNRWRTFDKYINKNEHDRILRQLSLLERHANSTLDLTRAWVDLFRLTIGICARISREIPVNLTASGGQCSRLVHYDVFPTNSTSVESRVSTIPNGHVPE